MKKITLLWIDDESERRMTSKVLERTLRIRVVFEDVKGKDLSDVLRRILSSAEPDLVLVDHRLDKVSGKRIIQTGSTTAEVIREKWPDCPMVCVTAVGLEDIGQHTKAIYEEIIEYSKLSENYSTLLSLANSFKFLRRNRPKDIDAVMKLLKPPRVEMPRLKDILPDALKGDYGDKSLLISLSKWIRHTLMAKPGFLYDQLWAATLLGIKEQSFGKLRDYFSAANYKGIFFNEGNQRWWQTRLKEILFRRFSSDRGDFTWVLGRKLPGITKRDYSVCYVCNKEYPEIVGFTDEIAQTRKPMHLRCSVPNPRFEKTLFFDEMRMMKAAG